MRGYELYKRWLKLSPEARDYAVGYMINGFDMHSSGFVDGHPSKPSADYALDNFDKAVCQAEIDLGNRIEDDSKGTER